MIEFRVLDQHEVENLMETSRTGRGGYLVQLQRFVESGDAGWDMSSVFTHKSPEAIRSSLLNNIDRHSEKFGWPKLKVMIRRSDEKCVIINLTAFAEAQGVTITQAEAVLEKI